ncbi:MAG: hypothetical protein HRT35_07085 [Algicola sp.]|nr:hypothetical protein [Algicola sp.]
MEFSRNKTNRLIRAFASPLMSNAKWVKLLGVLSSIKGINCKATVKLVWDENPRDLRIDDELEYNFDYYAQSMEAMISGYPSGWYDYKEIEWHSETSTYTAYRAKIKLHLSTQCRFYCLSKPHN